ncbi:gas vesicle structural protein GvpA [Actinomadura sp. ATCC 31491]|uniref:Gas vesicle protein A n=1 Tax=Actinomadura luzonensis TaxID=2805427 RepID=A0ABT0GB53_9ACTN|nr:gas vesicle protein GvpJ [Actinomadura luzonensis]MCK2221323.1 gas vesicle structural protein GvpA [Actinomadura luzonensis]
MTTSVQPAGTGQMGKPSSTGLADVIDTILDRGLVIDAYVRVSLVGIEILTIDTRIVIASVDTYLRFAEAANRLDMAKSEKGLPEVVAQAKGAPSPDKTKEVVQGVLEAADEKLADFADQFSKKREEQPAETETHVEREDK